MKMLMKTKRLAVGLAVVCSLPMAAQTADTWTLADTESGQSVALDKVAFLLAADNAEAFSVVCTDGVVMGGVRAVSFKLQDPSGIETVVANSVEPMLRGCVSGSLTLSGCSRGMNVRVYASDGRQMLSANATDSDLTLNVSTLPQGVYVLKAGGATIKFTKK